MARIRSIWPGICQSQDMASLPANLERTYVRLWTHCDDKGRAVDNPRLIKAALYPLNDEQTWQVVDAELAELDRRGFIVRYEVDGAFYLAVLAWEKYQKPQKPVPSRIPPLPEDYATPTGPLPEVSRIDTRLDLGNGKGNGSRTIAPVSRSQSLPAEDATQINADGIWTALEDLFGKASTRTERSLRGKLTKSLTEAGASYTSVKERSAVWSKLFPGRNGQPAPTLTDTALEKWWGPLGRIVETGKPPPPCDVCGSRRIVGVTSEGEVVRADDVRAVASERCGGVTR